MSRRGKDHGAAGATMSIIGHLAEIRSRLIWIIVTLIASVIVCSFFVNELVARFIEMGQGFEFVYIAPAELITSYIKIVLIAGLVITSPVILFQIWRFIRPAIEPHEKRIGLFAIFGATGFFVIGALFAYFIAVPMTIGFFVRFDTTGYIVAQISVANYINFLLSMFVMFGLVFEIPVLTFFLAQLGIVKPYYLVKTRKYAILVIFVVAMIITPPDIVSQLVVGIPMVVLYEISIIISRIIAKRKALKEQREAEEMPA